MRMRLSRVASLLVGAGACLLGLLLVLRSGGRRGLMDGVLPGNEGPCAVGDRGLPGPGASHTPAMIATKEPSAEEPSIEMVATEEAKENGSGQGAPVEGDEDVPCVDAPATPSPSRSLSFQVLDPEGEPLRWAYYELRDRGRNLIDSEPDEGSYHGREMLDGDGRGEAKGLRAGWVELIVITQGPPSHRWIVAIDLTEELVGEQLYQVEASAGLELIRITLAFVGIEEVEEGYVGGFARPEATAPLTAEEHGALAYSGGPIVLTVVDTAGETVGTGVMGIRANGWEGTWDDWSTRFFYQRRSCGPRIDVCLPRERCRLLVEGDGFRGLAFDIDEEDFARSQPWIVELVRE